MIANDSTEISQIVKRPMSRRRSRNEITGRCLPWRGRHPGPLPVGEGEGWGGSRFEEPGLRVGRAWGAAVLGDAGAVRDVAQAAADDADALRSRALAADADPELLVDDDAPDLLGDLV